MEIRESRQGGVLVVAPVGRVDTTTSEDLEQRLLKHVSGGDTRVVVDMCGIEYISSAGLRVLLMLLKKLQEAHGQLVLCSLGESVHQVFELAGFLTIFSVEPSLDLALTRLSKAG